MRNPILNSLDIRSLTTFETRISRRFPRFRQEASAPRDDKSNASRNDTKDEKNELDENDKFLEQKQFISPY
jgi:hypothetical protein